MLGMFLGTTVVTVLHALLTPKHMQIFGWRLAFLGGIPLAIIIYGLRHQIIKSTQSTNSFNVPHNYINRLLSKHMRDMVRAIFVNGLVVMSYTLIFLWLPTYLSYTTSFPTVWLHFTTTLSMLCLIILTLTFAKLSQHTASARLYHYGHIILCLFLIPFFYALTKSLHLWQVLSLQCLATLPLALLKSSNIEILTGLFNKPVRSLGLGISFSVSLTIFGGMTPVLASYLSHISYLAPAGMVILMGVITLLTRYH